ncbi:hypothetical protein [Paenibacillus contaminans]|nr:hypothetical protein [Paenibacillus contaminans]
MRKKEKKEITANVIFVDNQGNSLGTDPMEVLSKLTKNQLNRNLAILLEVTTGVRHKPGE